MTAQAASRHAVLGLALFLATACGRGAGSGRRPSLTAAAATSPRSRQQRPCMLRRSLHCDQHQPARQKTNTYADACPIFIARGKTHDPSSDFDAYIDVDIRANSHANPNAATNCYGYPDDTTCNSANGRGQYPTF